MIRQALVALSLTAVAISASLAQGSDVKKTVDKTVSTHEKTQQGQEKWEDEKSDLTRRYRSAKANVDYLTKRVEIEQKKSDALAQSIYEMNRRLTEAVRLEESLEDSLDAIVLRLEEWVESDLPFLMDERRTRIQNLKNDLAKPELDGAEKLRLVLQALQVEAGYGNDVDIHQDEIMLNGQSLKVDLLRVGRVSVFWRTPDAARAGEYDPGSGQWVELEHKYLASINAAIDMAAKVRPVEVVDLPLGRIQP